MDFIYLFFLNHIIVWMDFFFLLNTRKTKIKHANEEMENKKKEAQYAP